MKTKKMMLAVLALLGAFGGGSVGKNEATEETHIREVFMKSRRLGAYVTDKSYFELLESGIDIDHCNAGNFESKPDYSDSDRTVYDNSFEFSGRTLLDSVSQSLGYNQQISNADIPLVMVELKQGYDFSGIQDIDTQDNPINFEYASSDKTSIVIAPNDLDGLLVKVDGPNAVAMSGTDEVADLYKLRSLKDGATKEIYIDVDKGYTADHVIEDISAADLFGAEVPVTVTEGKDAFRADTLGEYTLKLEATDSYGQTANATIVVHVMDYTDPEISQEKPLSFTADKGEHLRFADIGSYVKATDNGTSHGSTLTVDYTFGGAKVTEGFDHEFTSADYPSKTLTVHAKDGSGNETTKDFVVKVNDGTAPSIERKDGAEAGSQITVGLSRTFSTKTDEVLSMFKATDAVDGDVSASLEGATEEDRTYFESHHHVGEDTLTIQAKDKVGNIATLKVTVKVVADIPPVFIIGSKIVYTDTAHPVSTQQLAKVAMAMLPESEQKTASVTITDDSGYHKDPAKAGTYHVAYAVSRLAGTKTDDSAKKANTPGKTAYGSFDLVNRDADAGKDGKEEKKPNAFVLFFQRLKNWFRGVFTKFRFDCFITDGEWDARYPEK